LKVIASSVEDVVMILLRCRRGTWTKSDIRVSL